MYLNLQEGLSSKTSNNPYKKEAVNYCREGYNGGGFCILLKHNFYFLERNHLCREFN